MLPLDRSTRHATARARTRRWRRVLRVLGPVAVAAAMTACLPDPAPWVPTDEDLGPDSGPDPGTCEARHDCGPVVK